MEVIGIHQLPGYQRTSKYIPLCSAEERDSYRFEKQTNKKKNPNKLNPLKFKKVSTYYLLYSFVIVTKVSGVFYRLLLQQLEIHPF